jgi:hypothetical protein
MELLFLPAYGPELQPAEHLWSLSDQVLVNRRFAALADLKAVLAPRLAHLTTRTEQIRSLTLFNWWPCSTPALAGCGISPPNPSVLGSSPSGATYMRQ